jgi:glutamate formiminotransferase
VQSQPLFESVPNFSEGRRQDVIDAIAAAAAPAFVLDTDADPDHHRAVITLAGFKARLVDGLLAAIAEAKDRIDLRAHHGVHPRVGAADVVPIVPLGDTTLAECRELAHDLAARVWSELEIPVYFYGQGEGRTLADIRSGRVLPDVGGPEPHPTAGAVCIGARGALVAFNVMLHGFDLASARALARSLRESSAGVRGVQALAFLLPGDAVQLSMNLFRVDETRPSDVIAELQRRGVSLGAQQIVGLCPAAAASPAADGRLLEGRLASSAAAAGAIRCRERGGEELGALALRLDQEAEAFAGLRGDQDAILGGGERAAALVHVLRAAGIADPELEALLGAAGRGFRAAVTGATRAIFRARVDALDARLA